MSVSTNHSSSHEKLGDTERAAVNESASQNQKTKTKILKMQMEKMTEQLQNLAQLNKTLEKIATAIILTNQYTKSEQRGGHASRVVE